MAGQSERFSMKKAPPIPEELREAVMAIARERFVRDGAAASVTLGDSYDARHPDGGVDADMARYFEDEWAPRRLKHAWADLNRMFAKGPVTVWRNVCIAGDPLEGFATHLRNKGWVGIFWTHDRDQAHPHDGPAGVPGVLLEARVEAASLDWTHTLASYLHPDWVGEEEIRLLPGGEVTMVSMARREGWLRRTSDDPCVPVPLGPYAGARIRAGDPAMAPRPAVEADDAAPGMAP